MVDISEISNGHVPVIAWGYGEYFTGNLWRISPETRILFAVDSNTDSEGYRPNLRAIKCKSPDAIKDYPDAVIMIAVRSRAAVSEISAILDNEGRQYFYIDEILRHCRKNAETEQLKHYNRRFDTERELQSDDIRFFLSVSVPVKACNLKCDYCYISHHGGVDNDGCVIPEAVFIRKALSRKRIGGTALINFCGIGETLLCKELSCIVEELLKEGHYVSIISNATLTNEIKKYTSFDESLRRRLFFKCSFHYLQLKKRELLKNYADNVKALRNSGISISVELVPGDELEGYMEELIDYCMDNFGALPHLTVPRDERQKSLPIMTKHSEEEFYDIWSRFSSDMFELKMTERKKRTEFCHAGEYGALLELDTGILRMCPFEPVFANAYSDLSKEFPTKSVGKNCRSAYCFNGHAYLTLGMISEWSRFSYYDMRARESSIWSNWLTPDIEKIFRQRICDNRQVKYD